MTRLTSRNKLLLAITVILICFFVGVSFLNYMITRVSVRAEILQNDLPLTMDNIYSELTAEMNRPLLVASSMASNTFLKEWVVDGERSVKKMIKYLRQMREKYGFFTTFFISAETKAYYRFNGIHKVISPLDSHDGWYYDFVNQNQEYALDVDTDEAGDNTLTIFINYKVLNQKGELLGVTGVGLQVEKVARLIAEYRKKYQRMVYLTDAEGMIQVHPDTSYIGNKSINQLDGLAPLMTRILNTKNGPTNFQFEREGERIFLTVRYIQSLSWFLYVEQDETVALVTARNNFIRTIVIGLMASCFIVLLTLVTINRYQDKLETFAVSDELTGIANRRALQTEFERALYAYSRSLKLFSLILMDLDGFKKVNDTKGHLAGDQVLINITKLIKTIIRPTDILARWGGDEFVVLCLGGGHEDAAIIAERIKQTVRMAELAGPGAKLDDPRNLITMSCGITAFCQGDDLDAMLLRADEALYRGKAKGGNCIEIEYV